MSKGTDCVRKYVCMYMYVKAVYAFLFFLYYHFASLLVFCEGRKKCILQPHLLVSFSKSFHN